MTTPATAPSAVRLELDAGIAHLVLDDPDRSANTMNAAFRSGFARAIDELEAVLADDTAAVRGVLVRSAKTTFFAGADLAEVITTTPETAGHLFAWIEAIKAGMRRLETIGRPVVAAINGAALGGGLEIALAAHRRIAVDGRYDLGLPEVTLGLLPGGGGVTRTVRMLGIQTALTEVLLDGRRLRPADALRVGIVDELVADADALLPAAIAWLDANAADPIAATQPWDRPGYRIPGGDPTTPAFAAGLPAFPARLRAATKGADLRAPRAILAAAIEGAGVDVDTALRIESRWFVDLAAGQQSKNLIQAFFFDRQAVAKGASRPAGVAPRAVRRLAVLGAGMMGAGIAHAAAAVGIEVVLKDVTLEVAEQGRDRVRALLDARVAAGRLTAAGRDEVLDRIHPTEDAADLTGADVLIEAVVESVELKHRVLAEAEAALPADALIGTNTSTLPITLLASGVHRSADVVGIHFFSPVERMPLVEIIAGERTSDEAVARAFDLAVQLRKTPIVVNDGLGFFTSRVYVALVAEAATMVGEGVPPLRIERAAGRAGFPGQPLAGLDEISLHLLQHIDSEGRRLDALAGRERPPSPASRVVERMVALGRGGRAAGAGFYDYPDDGPKRLWPGLVDEFGAAAADDADIDERDIEDRLRFVMSVETVRVLEEGVLRSFADGNIGSILGIGFPPATGGALQFVDGYEAPDGEVGVAAFARRAQELAERYGERFAPPALVRRAVADGRSLRDLGS